MALSRSHDYLKKKKKKEKETNSKGQYELKQFYFPFSLTYFNQYTVVNCKY